MRDGSGNNIVTTSAISCDGAQQRHPYDHDGQRLDYPVVGVSVQGNRTFNTFFARLLGFNQRS